MNTDRDWQTNSGSLLNYDRRTWVMAGVGVIAGFAIIAGITYLVFNWTRATGDAAVRATHTRDAVASLEETTQTIRDIDRQTGWYFLTTWPKYLAARNADIAALNDDLARLRDALADDSEQTERLTDLQPLITDYLSRLRAVGSTPTAARIRENSSALDEIQSRLAAMSAEEDRIQSQRDDELKQTIDSQPNDFLGFLVLGSITLTVFCTLAISRIKHSGEFSNFMGNPRRSESRRSEPVRPTQDDLSDSARSGVRGALTAIIGYCDLPLGPDSPVIERLETIKNQARQIVEAIGRPTAPTEAPTVSLSEAAGSVATGSNPFTVSAEPSEPAPEPQPENSAQPQPEARQRGTRILLAEDSPDLQKVIKFYLQELGADVTIVSDGKLACDHALADWKLERPFDLILMDVQMPNFDGRAATILLRDAGYRNPIVAITANATEQERNRCLAAGCNGFLEKPIDQEEFRRTMKRYLYLPSARSSAGSASSTDGGPSAASSSSELAALRESFEAEVPNRIADIKAAIDQGNIPHVIYLTHQLKGTAGCFGLSAICDAAAGLEKVAENPDLRENIQPCFQTLSRLGATPQAAKAAA